MPRMLNSEELRGKGGQVSMNIRLPLEQAKNLDNMALERGITRARLVREIVMDYLSIYEE